MAVDSKETTPSSHNWTKTHELRLLQKWTRSAHVHARQNPAQRRGSGNKVLSLTRKLFVTDRCWGRGNQFSGMMLGTHSRACLMGAQTSCCVAVLFRNFLGFLLLLLFSPSLCPICPLPLHRQTDKAGRQTSARKKKSSIALKPSSGF